ncbi:glycosyltransferase family A protein [uncultured Methanobrevibacter sp.]|uniref:glycosyltransferase family 2 protein n=1 Tax=uncultured Methanobrevibacter sp. TaxID=253161 RepID=UPI0025DE7B5E|nr:glycosyltransferase family A protein [uncultured Methanobrevibacter sp.]MEE1134945.1 glycosyltransferase family A protein [Methanobrevibacter sp.]
MDNFDVSVIVPVYNCEEYIGTTLDSIINQDFKNFEVIVIDDGSTDRSLEIINEKLSKSLISHQIIHQENSGVSSARNAGISKATGKYLVFIDGDDYVTGNHLSELYNGKSDFSLVQFIKKDGDRLSTPYHFSREFMSCEDFIKKELNMEMPFTFCQLMYKTSIIKDNGIKFNPDLVYGEDIDFALRALIYGDEVTISNEATYYYLQHPQSAINTSEFRRFEVIEIFEGIADFYKSKGRDDLANLVITSRIPKAIFGNMNYFFYNGYDFDRVLNKMKELDLLTKLSRYEGDSKFKSKIRLFLLSPKIYYKTWKKLKNSID